MTRNPVGIDTVSRLGAGKTSSDGASGASPALAVSALPSPPRCGALTKSGAPCRQKMNLSPTSGRCLVHDDERAAERAAMHSAGAKAANAARRRLMAADPADAPAEPRTLKDAERASAWVMRAVLTGVIDQRVGDTATKAIREFRLTVEKRVLAEKLRRLERKAKVHERGKK